MNRYYSCLLGVVFTICAPSLLFAQSVNWNFDRFEPPGNGTTYYVSPRGDDGNSGLTANSPFQSLQHASDVTQPGDTVLAMNGVYTQPGVASTVLYIERSGTPNNWIQYKAYPGHRPRIRIQDHWGGITIGGSSYILIEGFWVEGNVRNVSHEYAMSQMSNLNNPITAANGISLTNSDIDPEQFPHHIILRRNEILWCPGGGISSVHADYVRVENNRVHHNAWTTPYAASGISFYLNSNFDNRRAYKIFIRDNLCYRNENFVPHYYSNPNVPSERTVTDGNGITVDDTRNIQSGIPNTPYRGYTLITGNTTYSNGGRGILVYLSDNVLAIANTSYFNAISPTMSADVEVNESSSIIVLQNAIVPRGNRNPVEEYGNTNSTIQPY